MLITVQLSSHIVPYHFPIVPNQNFPRFSIENRDEPRKGTSHTAPTWQCQSWPKKLADEIYSQKCPRHSWVNELICNCARKKTICI